jgi:multidrug efflux pump subunit AcrA (membrane-fusion protein)
MIKILILLITFTTIYADKIELSTTKVESFAEISDVNAKIIQLSDQKQKIVSRVGGHLERYFVKLGDSIKKGDKIAKIQSLEFSKLSASYIATKAEYYIAKKSVANSKILFEKGLLSMMELSAKEIELSTIRSKRDTLQSQLISLGIDVNSLKKATDTFVITAHADGKIDKLLVTLHANINPQTPIVSLIAGSGYYAEAYMSIDTALKGTQNIQAKLEIADKSYSCKFISLMPYVDEISGQAKMLFWIESGDDELLLNAFVKMQIKQPSDKKLVTIKKSALSMFEGEWVVFVPNKEHKDEEDEHHEDHDRDEHDGHKEHNDHDSHNDHDDDLPYSVKVVKKLQSFGDNIAIVGLDEGEEYVSDGVYFVKSMLLKSKLGGHGH